VQVALVTVTEQVQNFPKTGYAADGASAAELAFERALSFGDGGWRLDADYLADPARFLGRATELCGPHLLSGEDSDAAQDSRERLRARHFTAGRAVQDFRSDRRLVRILLFTAMLRQLEAAQMGDAASAPTAAKGGANDEDAE
jgi:hypothetical protein